MISKADRFVVRVGAAVFTFAFATCASLSAQVSAATVLSGTVTDAAGKTVPGALITARNVASGKSTEVQADLAGSYDGLNLTPGDYEVSVAAPGFSTAVTRVTVTAVGRQTVDLTVRGLLSLEDLGLTLAQAEGSAAQQALLDKRSHMLKLHQRYGLIAVVPLVATVIAGSASGKNSSSSGRNLHAALGITAAALYSISAYYAIAAPKIPGTEEKTKGNIRLHKALAWVHGPGMVLTPILGAMAYEQRQRGEKVHGIASAHSGVAIVTVAAYGAAILTESFR